MVYSTGRGRCAASLWAKSEECRIMKKLIALFIACALCMSGALAEALTYADTDVDLKAFERYMDYAPDAKGDFIVKCAKASALEALFSAKLQAYSANGFLCFFVEVHGNQHTRLTYPVLKILYSGREPLNARAVSFAFDGKRYDFAVSTVARHAGRFRVEESLAYLDEAGMEFISALKAAARADICLAGETQYIQAAEAKANYANQRLELAGESFSALKLPDGAPDYADYAFASLTERAYESKTGVEARMEVCDLSAQCPVALDRIFSLVGAGANGMAIRDTQRLLKSAGFLAGAETTVLSDDMLASVMRAQAYYGLIVTGYADARLINLLSGAEVFEPMGEEREKAPLTYTADIAAFTLDRWWIADAVETTVPGGGRARADKDHALVLADGEILGLGAEAVSLSWEAGATITYDGKWPFPAQLYCEMSGGESLGASLGVLDRARLVIVAEVPAYLAEEGGAFTLSVRIGAKTFDIELGY